MLSKLLGSSVVVIGLLAGVQEGSAQTLFACKNNTSGSLIFYATQPTCGPGNTLVSYDLSGPAAGLGASAFSCQGGSLVQGGSLSGSYTPGLTFGTGISYNGGPKFLLQPGIYSVQLSAYPAELGFSSGTSGAAVFFVNLNLFGGASFQFKGATTIVPGTTSALVPVNGNALFQISGANTTVDFEVNFSVNINAASSGGCDIVFTRLQ